MSTVFDCQKAFLIPCRTVWFKPPSTALADSPRFFDRLRGQSSEDFKGQCGPNIDLHRYVHLSMYHCVSIYLSIYIASYLSKWFEMHVIGLKTLIFNRKTKHCFYPLLAFPKRKTTLRLSQPWTRKQSHPRILLSGWDKKPNLQRTSANFLARCTPVCRFGSVLFGS